MRVLYIEGVAIHGGPESCVGVREGVGEALAGVVRAGLLSREMSFVRGADAFIAAAGNIVGGVIASRQRPRAVEEPRQARRSSCARTGRSRGRPRVVGDAPSGMVRGVADRRLGVRGGNA